MDLESVIVSMITQTHKDSHVFHIQILDYSVYKKGRSSGGEYIGHKLRMKMTDPTVALSSPVSLE